MAHPGVLCHDDGVGARDVRGEGEVGDEWFGVATCEAAVGAIEQHVRVEPAAGEVGHTQQDVFTG